MISCALLNRSPAHLVIHVQMASHISLSGNKCVTIQVAQLYLDFPASAQEPPKQLKGFQKV